MPVKTGTKQNRKQTTTNQTARRSRVRTRQIDKPVSQLQRELKALDALLAEDLTPRQRDMIRHEKYKRLAALQVKKGA